MRNGEVENLKRSTIKKLADLFEVSPSYLMCLDTVENLVQYNFNDYKSDFINYVNTSISKNYFTTDNILFYKQLLSITANDKKNKILIENLLKLNDENKDKILELIDLYLKQQGDN